MQLFIGYEEKGEAWGEHAREEESSSNYLLQRWSCWCKIFTVQTGEEKVRKNEEKTLNTLLCDCGAAINCGSSFNYLIQ